jgi:hypothetical protein
MGWTARHELLYHEPQAALDESDVHLSLQTT